MLTDEVKSLAYVATCRDCDKSLAVTMIDDRWKRETANTVAAWIRKGWKVELRENNFPVRFSRENVCQCRKEEV